MPAGNAASMIVDAQDPAVAVELDTPTVIVGAGAAGLTLALAFADKGLRCLVLEAGGERLDSAAQDFYRAARIAPDNHGPVHLYRRRGFGGTTAIWGGRCIPFDPIDFEDRPWIAHARWPITYGDVGAILCQGTGDLPGRAGAVHGGRGPAGIGRAAHRWRGQPGTSSSTGSSASASPRILASATANAWRPTQT